MGFLDNSGDIILDAVLTDTGRWRLSKGNGAFNITQYAFADDEINYELYRNANHTNGAHPSGSAYFDLNILQTPVLEAFTNNTSMMKSKLVTIGRNDVLYLPMLKLNEEQDGWKRNSDTDQAAANGNKFVVTVDTATNVPIGASVSPGVWEPAESRGMINGVDAQGTVIRVDQGLDTDEISPSDGLAADLRETQFIVEIDNRLGSIASPGGGNTTLGATAEYAFLDDDQIATYYFNLGTDTSYVVPITETAKVGEVDTETIRGPRGTRFQFKIKSSTELATSTYLFKKIGTFTSANNWTTSTSVAKKVHFIDSIIRVTGGTTGYKIDIPVRFAKLG